MIEIRNLSKRFGPATVLDSLDLDIPTGECMVVLGRSGCGKSVLLKHIIGLIRPDAGTIHVDGTSVGGLNYSGLADLRRRFGMLFQMAALFDSMTVGENVGLALREHTRRGEEEIVAICEEKLNLVGLPGIQEKKPADLSGGMRKRVGLARAIAMDPAYVLYDEPTTGLDPITAEQINLLIRDLQRSLKITSVVVTHDMRSAFTVGDRLCLLHQGRIRFVGGPEEFKASPDPLVQQFIRGEASGPMTDAAEASNLARKA
jgi:phospholipid/cholesterol/gamma-HCH transport system ATP-binding protein